MSQVEEVRDLPAVLVKPERSAVVLTPVMDVNTAMARMKEFQAFCANYLEQSSDGGQDGGDYGAIPGAGKKKVLLKSGADKLCEIYGLYDEYEFETKVENFETGLFDYTLKCVLKSRRDDSQVGTGVGSCSSYESKYRWRDAKRVCPKCGKATIIKGQAQYGGGWVCWFKEGKSDGCKAKFDENDRSITEQVQGRIENPDIIDTKNTVLKMAKKRAKIDATIGVTRSSGIFTQDLDDLPPPTTKPPAERTTEDEDISGPGTKSTAPPAFVGESKEPKAANTAGESGPLPPAPNSDCISAGQATNFYVEFKKALPAKNKKDSDELAKDWLRSKKIVDALGQPSALAIKIDSFLDVRTAACEYAKTYFV